MEDNGTNRGGVILPVGLVKLLEKLCENAGDNAEIELGVRGRALVAKVGNVTASGLLVEGIYPNYNSVIPKNNTQEIGFKSEVLEAGLRKCAHLMSAESNSVQFTFTPGLCVLESRSPEKGKARVEVPVEYAGYAGESVGIGLNPFYVADVLKAFGVETARLEMKDGSTPVVLRAGKDFLCVVMPVAPRD